MAKKEKVKPIPPEVKFKRQLRRYAKRTLLVAAIVAFYFLGLPVIMPNMAPQVAQTKESLSLISSQVGKQASQVLGVATKLTAEVLGSKETLQEKGAEALVQETVDDLTQRLKKLPGEQVEKVKTKFCADLIEEAVLSCEATQSGSED